MKNMLRKIAMLKSEKLKKILADNSGQGALDTALTVLIAVVLTALILAGLYALIDDTVLPTLTTRVQELFNYTH